MESPALYCAEILSEEDEEMQQENGGGDDDDHDNDDDDDDNDDNNDDDDDDPDDIDMNYIRILIGQEIAGVRLNEEEVEELVNDNWNQEIRTHAIRYIRRIGRQFLLSRRTLYRAVIYLDRFLARRIIANGELWAVRLLTVTCLSLSAKMDESRDNVPPLSDYPLGSYNINVNAIRRMEILVLNEFNWDMNCVTPFAFINFFLLRFCRDVTRRIITRRRTAVIIMSAFRDLRLMNHRPSVIAAAATLLAITINFTIEDLEIEINALPIYGFLQIGHVSYCYYRLLELNI
ncbi:cyclin-D5-3-like [Solanum dulcamara]|uniref:cyclin-D5-3-like n=1 Tax=Solanum dulcamara TaxID=45834 RepID=UPI0024861E11|nr:cyclin-D5-3-like [Solanum dulcamara]